jgi:ABC-2 type transport system ATP-binding protein
VTSSGGPDLPIPTLDAADAARPVLDVRDLRKQFRDLTAVEDISFEVRPGEIVGLVGPNGAGKTTTLRCVAGVIPATWGTVHVDGRDLAKDPAGAKRGIAYLPDEPRLFDHLTVREHLNFFARVYGVGDWRPKAEQLLAELELTGKEGAIASELSRGMKQKLSIACGFLHDPRLLLLDEPLTGLDPLGMRRMKQALSARARAGAALVLSSHLLGLVEELCHRIVVLARGRIVASGTLEEIRARLTGANDASLEDVFVRVTEGKGSE